MTTKEQRPWRATAKAVEGDALRPDSTLPDPADNSPTEAAGRPSEADGSPEATASLSAVLTALMALLTRLATVLDRQADARPRIEPLAYRIDELADVLGVSRRAIERERAAGRFPRPDLTIGKMPLWRRETVRAFLERGGRP
jgi:hypothetical protein